MTQEFQLVRGISATYDPKELDILRLRWGQGTPDRILSLPRLSTTELTIHGVSIDDIELLAYDLLKIIHAHRGI